jgi:hypothetical protein
MECQAGRGGKGGGFQLIFTNISHSAHCRSGLFFMAARGQEDSGGDPCTRKSRFFVLFCFVAEV